MPDTNSDDEAAAYKDFMQWVQERGVSINGIRSVAQPGRGRGIFTTKAIKQGDLLVNVPVDCILTVPRSTRREETVQGRLAARLLADAQGRNKPWMSVMPSLQDMRDSMPLMWPTEVTELLPEGASDVLEKQRQKFENDWTVFSDAEYDFSASKLGIAMPDERLREQYLYCWLLVNTRCFYWDFPTGGDASKKARRGHGASMKVRLPDSECMALCPFMDFFNHDNHGIQASYNRTGYFVAADRDYAAGEEILFSYGSYTNDFLLVEYGFMLVGSDSDGVRIDSVILPILNTQQQEDLRDSHLLGNYTLSPSGTLCHRTQCALRASFMPSRQLNRFVRGESGGEKEQPAVDALAKEVLAKFRNQVVTVRLRQLASLAAKAVTGAITCERRWQQIEPALTDTCKSL